MLFVAVVSICVCPLLQAQHVIATIPVPGIDMQIPLAINPNTNRLYALSDETSMDVIDTASNTVVGVVPVGGYPTGVAVNPRTNLIYVPILNYTVNVIDGQTNTILHEIAVPNDPHFPAVNPVTNRIYVVQDFTVTVIDGATNSVIANIAGFAGLPIVAIVNSDTNQVLVTYQSPTDAGYSVIDGSTNLIVRQVSLAGFAQYIPLLNSADADLITGRIYFGDNNNPELFVLELNTQEITKVGLTASVRGVAAIRGSKFVLACRFPGHGISMVNVGSGQTVRNITVGAQPGAVTYNPANGRAYVANLGDRTISVLAK
jgi:YVTN family beta-propeller protein